MTGSILHTIVEQKRREIAQLPDRAVSVGDLKAALERRGGLRDFAGTLRGPRVGRVALIAEVKQASPSAGVICPDFDPVRIARAYEAAGADCLSVLTDEVFFQGSLADLRRVRAEVNLPLLRKDFILDDRQILEAIEWGADAILLIAAILDDTRLRRFHALAAEAGLAVLVEVHEEAELDRALGTGARLIGVNNRDLRTFKVDLATTERLAARARREGSRAVEEGSGLPCPPSPAPPLLVAESGILTRPDVERVTRAGARAILVGESLMRSGDLKGKVAELLGVGSSAA
jgi:indole-3-glycerol phosphate synthase